MNVRSIFLLLFLGIQSNRLTAELSPSSCSILRTATGVATMVPELAQLVTRYYISSAAADHPRTKRFLFNDQTSRDASMRGTVLDQMVANAFKDVNYTKVAYLLFHNDESLAKIRQNVNPDVILRAMMREIDFEQFGQSLWYAFESEFSLERFIHSFLNITHLDIIHEEIVTNGTVPEWFVKSIHPDLNVRTVNRMLTSVKNLTRKAFEIMSNSDKLDDYLLQLIRERILKPLSTILQRVKDEKPATLDRTIEIILSSLNRAINEQFGTTTKATTMATTKKLAAKGPVTKSTTTTTTVKTTPVETVDVSDDLKVLFYQSSIMIQSAGQTVRVGLKAIEQLYCASIWE